MLLGLAAGDALGVPVEFCKRAERISDPVKEMRAFGSHMQEAGTWSDDASLTFCTVEAMLEDFSPELLGKKFLRWFLENHWTARGRVFDIGIATRQALQRLGSGISATAAGGREENSNGNGSLMRIAPLAWHPEQDEMAFFRLVSNASSITHGHKRSIMACHFYLEFLRLLLEGETAAPALQQVQREWPEKILRLCPAAEEELPLFKRLLSAAFTGLNETEIHSGGYVIHSLEASLWCLLNTATYREAVEMAVNLGEDTDTTAAICGALAGTLYGGHSIPEEWLSVLAGTDEIELLAHSFAQKFEPNA